MAKQKTIAGINVSGLLLIAAALAGYFISQANKQDQQLAASAITDLPEFLPEQAPADPAAIAPAAPDPAALFTPTS